MCLTLVLVRGSNSLVRYVTAPELLRALLKINTVAIKNMERCHIYKNKETRFADKDLSSWTGLGGPDMSEVRVLVPFRTFRVQN